MGIVLDLSPTEASPVDLASLKVNLHRSRRWANLELALLILMGFCYAAWLGTGAIKVALLHRGLPVVSASEDELTPIELVEVLVALPSLLILLASLIVWFFWLYRAYGNLRLVGLRTTTYSTRWAIGCWFIPFVNLLSPYRVVSELTLRSEDGNTWPHGEGTPGPTRVLCWWILTFLSRVIGRFADVDKSPLDLSAEAMTLLEMGSFLTDLVWVALTFLIVRNIRDDQDRWPARAEPQLVVSE